MQKSRSAGIVRSGPLVGDVRGRMAILLDDLISGGTTLANAATACHAAGAERIYAAATHGNFSVNAEQVLASSPIDKLIITDTITLNHLSQSFIQERVHVIETADYLAAAIRCLHTGDSIVDLNATDAQHPFHGSSARPSSPE
jgi:ribose-phosphate pyrophosphokinase